MLTNVEKKNPNWPPGAEKKNIYKKISSPANKRENATNPHKYELFSLRQSKPNYSTYTSLPNNSRSVKNSHEKKEDRLEKKITKNNHSYRHGIKIKNLGKNPARRSYLLGARANDWPSSLRCYDNEGLIMIFKWAPVNKWAPRRASWLAAPKKSDAERCH